MSEHTADSDASTGCICGESHYRNASLWLHEGHHPERRVIRAFCDCVPQSARPVLHATDGSGCVTPPAETEGDDRG